MPIAQAAVEKYNAPGGVAPDLGGMPIAQVRGSGGCDGGIRALGEVGLAEAGVRGHARSR
ncbi:MAG TPA: hypothetical protein VIS06_00625 [Mycobacteriales bacterium]